MSHAGSATLIHPFSYLRKDQLYDFAETDDEWLLFMKLDASRHVSWTEHLETTVLISKARTKRHEMT